MPVQYDRGFYIDVFSLEFTLRTKVKKFKISAVKDINSIAFTATLFLAGKFEILIIITCLEYVTL